MCVLHNLGGKTWIGSHCGWVPGGSMASAQATTPKSNLYIDVMTLMQNFWQISNEKGRRKRIRDSLLNMVYKAGFECILKFAKQRVKKRQWTTPSAQTGSLLFTIQGDGFHHSTFLALLQKTSVWAIGQVSTISSQMFEKWQPSLHNPNLDEEEQFCVI